MTLPSRTLFFTLALKERRADAPEREREPMAGGVVTRRRSNPTSSLDFGHAREVVEKSFRFTPDRWGYRIFGVAVPYGLYKACVNEFNAADDKYGRERKGSCRESV